MNEEFVIDVLADIEESDENPKAPYHLDMSTWFSMTYGISNGLDSCGTTACFAGFATLRAGYTPIQHGDHVIGTDGQTWDVEWLGGHLCGFDLDEAESVFYADDLDEVYELIADFMGVAEPVLRDKVAAEVQNRKGK